MNRAVLIIATAATAALVRRATRKPEPRWRLCSDDPPDEYEDVLLMWGDGTVSRSNTGTHDATWWRPIDAPPRQEDYFQRQCTAEEALEP